MVRLNPTIPSKTRGNAALTARFAHGRGPSREVGRLPEGPVRCYSAGRDLTERERDRLADELWATVVRTSAWNEPGTDPALLLLRRKPPAALYWEAVRRVVTLDEVSRWLRGTDAVVHSAGSGMGRIGAAAALAWPGAHPTWEAIAYREPAAWGTDRGIDRASVADSQARHRELFLCTDPRTRRLLVAPHTACPILFGLRATDPEVSMAALREVRSEPVERWMLFRTNQGTGDHVRRPWPVPPVPFTTGTLAGRLLEPAVSLPGGHLRFELVTAAGLRVPCVVFEPTKTLPAVVRSLSPGDRIRLWGGAAADTTFRVEGVELRRVSPRLDPGPNPRCPRCNGRMRSLGSVRGFRCDQCRVRAPPEQRRPVPQAPKFPPGLYHPTPSARRHLAPRGPEPGISRGRMD